MPKRMPGERWRYIAFTITSGSEPARGDFLNALMMNARGTPLDGSFRITVFERNFGILKVPHTLKDEAIRVLKSVEHVKGVTCTVDTLRTSGTIKTLKQKYSARMGMTGGDPR
jgi:RNase P/RNase MRP subunit POP5